MLIQKSILTSSIDISTDFHSFYYIMIKTKLYLDMSEENIYIDSNYTRTLANHFQLYKLLLKALIYIEKELTVYEIRDSIYQVYQYIELTLYLPEKTIDSNSALVEVKYNVYLVDRLQV